MGRNSKQWGVSRRDVFKGGLAVAAVASAGALAACSPKGASSESSQEAGLEWDYESDVLVIGLGTGLGAVLTAVESGATVIGVDKHTMIGGNWALNSGVFFAPATEAMALNGAVDERTGQPDTVETAIEDWYVASKGVCNKVLLEKLFTEQKKLIDDLVAEGYSFDTRSPGMSNNTVARGHLVLEDGVAKGGGSWTQILSDRVSQTDAQIMLETAVTNILFDDDYNAIGVEAKQNGSKIRIRAKAIVVATGGYPANQYMRNLLSPETAGWGLIGGTFSTGECYRMLFDHDATICSVKEVRPTTLTEKNTAGFYAINDYSDFWAHGPRAYIILDDKGKRNRNEQLPYTQAPEGCLTVPNYQVFDQSLLDDETFNLCSGWTKDTLNKAIEDGIIVKADTAEELATKLYLDAETIKSTIDDFNAAAASGSDSFGRNGDSMKAFEPPFYASIGTNGFAGAYGVCIAIDEDGHVVDAQGNPIKGVYAGGNDMYFENWAGPDYIASGTGAGCGYGMSALSGRNAAAYALG